MGLVRRLTLTLALTLTIAPLAGPIGATLATSSTLTLAALAIVPATGATIAPWTAFLHPLGQLLALGRSQNFAHGQHALKAQVAHLLHLRLNPIVLLAELVSGSTTRHQPAHFLAGGLDGLALLLHPVTELLAHLAEFLGLLGGQVQASQHTTTGSTTRAATAAGSAHVATPIGAALTTGAAGRAHHGAIGAARAGAIVHLREPITGIVLGLG